MGASSQSKFISASIPSSAHAVRLAVVAHVRHVETPYDKLLMNGWERVEAHLRVEDTVRFVLAKWQRNAGSETMGCPTTCCFPKNNHGPYRIKRCPVFTKYVLKYVLSPGSPEYIISNGFDTYLAETTRSF